LANTKGSSTSTGFKELVKETLKENGMFFDLNKFEILNNKRRSYGLKLNQGIMIFYGTINDMNREEIPAIDLPQTRNSYKVNINHISAF